MVLVKIRDEDDGGLKYRGTTAVSVGELKMRLLTHVSYFSYWVLACPYSPPPCVQQSETNQSHLFHLYVGF